MVVKGNEYELFLSSPYIKNLPSPVHSDSPVSSCPKLCITTGFFHRYNPNQMRIPFTTGVILPLPYYLKP
jgi:hypothetical protein